MLSSLMLCNHCGASNRPEARFCTSCGKRLQTVNTPVQSLTGMLNPNVLLGQRYRVVKLVGQGGMGAVYQVEDLRLRRALRAAKELSQNGMSGAELRAATEAFEREAQMLAQLSNSHLPRIYAHFPENGRWYLVMDFIEGETLSERLNRTTDHKFTAVAAVGIALQLCEVLHELHTYQPPIIFRDLKPANIMLTAQDHVYLIDFGIARFFKQGQAKDTIALGSPGYAAPEQYGRSQSTPGSDIYGLGATLHQMLSGHDPSADPFQFADLQLDHLTGGSELAELVAEMVEMKREKRPASALEVKQRLEQIALQLGIKQPEPGSPSQAPHTPPPIMPSAPLITAKHPAVLPPVPASINGPDLVVDQSDAKQYRSINEALTAALPGQRILIHPGYYRESLLLDKPVELIGTGACASIIVEGVYSSTLRMRTTKATVSGLTLRYKSVSKPAHVVDIRSGQLLLEDCDIHSSSPSHACIFVQNAAANPVVRRCRIHDSTAEGIVFDQEAKGTVEHCEIFGNQGAGLVIKNKADPLIKHCRLDNGTGNGIYISANGKGTIEDCTIVRHLWAAVAIEDGGNPLLSRCEIADGKGPGVYVSKRGRGTLEQCHIHSNAQSGIVVLNTGDPLLRQCKIYDGKQAGIYVHRKGMGTFEECDIYNNVAASVEVKKEGNPVLRRCIIHDGKQAGVDVYDKGLGIIEECDIYNNAFSGITISDRSFPTVRTCKIHHGKRSGILICDSGQGTIEDCDIYANMQAGITICRFGDPVIRRCHIHDEQQEAIYVHDNGRGTVIDCDLRNNKKGAWDIRPDCTVRRARNKE
jgi:F-box protein 11